MKSSIPTAVIAICIAATIGCSRSESPPKEKEAQDSNTTEQKGKTVTAEWPFADAENTAVLTLTRVMDGSKPILYVVHDEDGDWQFLDGGDVSEEDATIVSLKRIVDLDYSIKTLADLPIGWGAERDAVGKPWQRFQK